MCGISCLVCAKDENPETTDGLLQYSRTLEHLYKLLRKRGPDLSSKKCLSSEKNNLDIELCGNILWTQGSEISFQPCATKDDSKFLLFNGDIYSFTSGTDPEESIGKSQLENDTTELFKRFVDCDTTYTRDGINSFLEHVGRLRGPFAFIYIDKQADTIWFARDFFGRESLLFSSTDYKSTKIISSVSLCDVNIFEIPAAGVYAWNLSLSTITLYKYACHERKDIAINVGKFKEYLENVGIKLESDSMSIKLSFSTQVKVPVIPENTENDFVKDEEHLLQKIIKSATEIDPKKPTELLEELSVILDENVEKFLQLLRKSVQIRIGCQPRFCKNCIGSRQQCSCSKVAVLFSGGLDSTVLAYLALELLSRGETIDLINVAFSKQETFTNVPDRETGIQSFHSLKKVFAPQGKNINFVCVNVQREEVELMRNEVIRDLISPLKSVLDDSLGCCLWFAGRCSGKLYEQNDNYISPARVVLLGSGADELIGGYGRHRSAFYKRGWLGLASEMQEDIDRISIRNLGRDNRIVSDHGVCPRMPFLDEDLVTYVTGECELWMKCCPLDVGALGQRGLGEKLLLRAAAAKLFGHEHIGIAIFPKRAMQFGSRIAKLENSGEKGADECVRLKGN